MCPSDYKNDPVAIALAVFFAALVISALFLSPDQNAYCSCVRAGTQSNATCAQYANFPDRPEVCEAVK